MPAQAAHRARGANPLKKSRIQTKRPSEAFKAKRAFIITVPSAGLSFPGSLH